MSQPIDTASVKIVPDFSGFSAEANQEVNQELRKVATTARTAFAQVERAASEAGHEIAAELRVGGAVAEGALREVGTQGQIMAAKVAASSAEAGSALGGRIAAGALVAKAAVAGIALAVTAGLGAITTFGLRSAAQLEQTRIGITALVGSVEEANQLIRELQEFSAATPFEFAGITDAARRVLAFGDAVGITRDEVIPTLTTIGNLVSVLGGGQEELNSVLRAIGQIASSGRLLGGELQQISQALPGFSPAVAIAEQLGIAVKDVDGGVLDATTAINALLAGMAEFRGAAGAMEAQSQTLLGVFSTFKDVIGQALTGAFEPVIPAIKDALAEITPILGDAIGELAPSLGGLLAALLPLAGQLVSALVPIITPILDALGPALQALAPALQPLGDALGRIFEAIAPLLPVIGEALNQLIAGIVDAAPIDEFVTGMAELVPVLGDLLLAIVPLIPSLIELLTAITPLLVIVAPLAADLLRLATQFGVAPVVKALAVAFSFLSDSIAEFAHFLTAVDWAAVWGAITGAVSGAFTAVVGFFHDLPGNIAGFLRQLPSRAADALNQMAFIVGVTIGRIIRFFLDLPAQIIAALVALPGLLVAFFTTTGNNARTVIANAFNSIVDFARGLPSRLLDALRTMISGIATFASELVPRAIQLGRDIVGGIISGIRATIGGIGRTLMNGLNSAIDGIQHGLGIGSPSKVLAAEVGRWLPPGIEEGVQQATPSLLSTIAGLVGDISAITGRGSPSSSLTVDVGGVVVNGSATVSDATTIGATVGRSVAAAARRSQLALAVRMR